MALTETNKVQDKKPVEHNRGADKKDKLPTKVIIRRLPPQMESDTFLNQISPIPSYDYFYMVKGDLNLGENAFSRAYINFTNPNDVYDFKEKFDNYVFIDSNTGHEYSAVVEFAAFQKIPKKRNKIRVDPKCGTIESDPIYQEFVEIIKNPPAPQPEEKPEYTLQLLSENKNSEIVSTPLLEFIKNKRAERLRIREERREERRKKDFERRKYQDDRKKMYDDSISVKYKNQYTKNINKENNIEKETEKPINSETIDENKEKQPQATTSYEKFDKSVYYKSREKKYDERKREARGKYPMKKEYSEKREYKSRRDDFNKDYKKLSESDFKTQKKVKKYSEKREERKIEAQKKLEQDTHKDPIQPKEEVLEKSKEEKNNEENIGKQSSKKNEEKNENREKSKTPENDNTSQKRIRNKDRPSIAIYRPGMLSKRKQAEEDIDNGKKE